jgi:hypothetical protein
MREISKKLVAHKLDGYLNRRITRSSLIHWCEHAMQEHTFESKSTQSIVAKLGLMGAKNFDLSYDELYRLVRRLGYTVRAKVRA